MRVFFYESILFEGFESDGMTKGVIYITLWYKKDIIAVSHTD